MTIAAAEDELSLAERLFLDFVDAEELPVAAMVEASGAWEECRAFFLETLRGYAAGDIDPTGDGDAPLILIHLLGQQRERLAWLPLIALLRQDIDTLEAALGDALTDTLPRILVGVFDGDPTPLEELLVDTSVDGSCRWSAFDAYIGLHVRGAFGAERMERLLTRVAETEIPADDMAWIAWLKGCALLADATLRDRAAALCAAGLTVRLTYELRITFELRGGQPASVSAGAAGAEPPTSKLPWRLPLRLLPTRTRGRRAAATSARTAAATMPIVTSEVVLNDES
jgi:hypothetical protein